MYRTFNMGIGMIAIVNDEIVEDVLQQFTALGETPYIIGEVLASGDEDGEWVTIEGINK